MQVFATRTCERAIRKLLGKDARREMEEAIADAPDAALVVRGTGGIRKLRRAGLTARPVPHSRLRCCPPTPDP